MGEKRPPVFKMKLNYLVFSYLLHIFYNNLLVLTKICSENNNNVSYVQHIC